MSRFAALLVLAATGCNLFNFQETDTDSGGTGDDATGGQATADLFIAVGDQGTILRSPDGATWTLATSGVTVALNAAAYHDGTFVAVGQAGKIVYSPDGSAWKNASSPSSRDLLDVEFHNGRFIAVGGDYSAGADTLESKDGITWTRPELLMPQHLLQGLATDGVTLVAIGAYTVDKMTFGQFVWSEGVGWTQHIDGAATNAKYSAIAHGAPNFAMIGPVSAATSGDGLTWTSVPLFSVAAAPRAIGFGQGGWIAVGDGGVILGSAAAVQWTPRPSPVMTNLLDVASDGLNYVAVGAAGQIVRSGDGVTWTPATSGVGVELRGVMHTHQ